MTRADAQLLYDWFVQRYGLPLEGMATPALVNSNADHQQQPNAKCDRDRRMHRQEHRNQDDAND